MLDLDEAIRMRHSTRMFLPHQPVQRELVNEALALAQSAPSNSNIQPWHMLFASGASSLTAKPGAALNGSSICVRRGFSTTGLTM